MIVRLWLLFWLPRSIEEPRTIPIFIPLNLKLKLICSFQLFSLHSIQVIFREQSTPFRVFGTFVFIWKRLQEDSARHRWFFLRIASPNANKCLKTSEVDLNIKFSTLLYVILSLFWENKCVWKWKMNKLAYSYFWNGCWICDFEAVEVLPFFLSFHFIFFKSRRQFGRNKIQQPYTVYLFERVAFPPFSSYKYIYFQLKSESNDNTSIKFYPLTFYYMYHYKTSWWLFIVSLINEWRRTLVESNLCIFPTSRIVEVK